MDSVLRTLMVYLVLLVLFRLAGKRSLAQVTTFDLVLVLVIGEATQQALLGEDFSITQAAIVIGTLLALERGFDYLSWRFPRFGRWAESAPVMLVVDGRPNQDVMDHYHLSLDDVVTAGREQHGLANLEQVRYAVLEVSGGISVVPRETRGTSR